MIEVYNRVCAWNAARYDRQYNHELSCSLLHEELTEFFTAEGSEVDELDALCDIIFVAFGIIWKMNYVDDAFYEHQNNAITLAGTLLEVDQLLPVFHISSVFQALQYDSDMAVGEAAFAIAFLAMAQMDALGLVEMSNKLDALFIVCDSNDSKSIKKVDSHVKANTDKGPFFISPEPRLQALLDKVRGHGVH
jgi:hypothetical protein